MQSGSYKDLIVWQKAIELVVEVFALAQQLPAIEKYALADQIRRCSVSIPSNIAEGQKRYSKIEFRRFCLIALGSAAELETQLIIIDRTYYIDITAELSAVDEVSRLLNGLIKSL